MHHTTATTLGSFGGAPQDGFVPGLRTDELELGHGQALKGQEEPQEKQGCWHHSRLPRPEDDQGDVDGGDL